LYRLRTIAITPNGEKSTFLTYSRAICGQPQICSQFTDLIWILLNHLGNVLGVRQSVSGGALSDYQNLKQLDVESKLAEFNTYISIKHTELAPIPDTSSFIQKMERERDLRERGETKDNRSCFAKYWMYIVLVAILVLISGATNLEARA
jgi:ER membrane protein complex subunit 10